MLLPETLQNATPSIALPPLGLELPGQALKPVSAGDQIQQALGLRQTEQIVVGYLAETDKRGVRPGSRQASPDFIGNSQRSRGLDFKKGLVAFILLGHIFEDMILNIQLYVSKAPEMYTDYHASKWQPVFFT
jgi:hypothetical protein